LIISINQYEKNTSYCWSGFPFFLFNGCSFCTHFVAEQRFREDLNQYRNNGWSLLGLYQRLEAQGKKKEVMEAKKQYDKAFVKAYIDLKSVRY
jgi:hypothetical protein